MEQTLIIIKPDAVERGLTQPMTQFLEKENFEVIASLKSVLPFDVVRILYEEHASKPFFVSVLNYMTSSQALVLVVQREDAIAHAISLCGCTDPTLAEPHTIRGIWGLNKEHNSIHRSDSQKSAQREIAIFFPTLIDKVAPIFSFLDSE
jgi:nucleoside-diphosphate kinase